MSHAFWSKSRRIVARIVVEGDWIATAPLHVGSGEKFTEADAPLLRDALTQRPLLTGTSLAGAFRSYIAQIEAGHRSESHKGGYSELLFGGIKGDDSGLQSPLIISDSIGDGQLGERDGVHLNPKSRTAEAEKLFNVEIWQRGTYFPLHFELLVYEQEIPNLNDQLCRAFLTLLVALQEGKISIGGRKTRGYGRGRVQEWHIQSYDFTSADDLLAWLAYDPCQKLAHTLPPSVNLAADLGLGDQTTPLSSQADEFTIQATFQIPHSLMIRTYRSPSPKSADTISLNEEGQALLSATSLAGAWRARATKIAYLVAPNDEESVEEGIKQLFGYGDNGDPKEKGIPPSQASKVSFEENVLEGMHLKLVQTRIKIDRFTGGVIEGALFDEQPAWGGDQATCQLNIKLINPNDAEIGLMLLVLKDLWLGDMALGGTSSIGRGRLAGQSATLRYQTHDQKHEWQLDQHGKVVMYQGMGDSSTLDTGKKILESYVEQLWGIG